MQKTFLLFMLLLAANSAFSQQTSAENQPKIYVESTTIDYGIVKKGSDGTRKLKVHNKGTAPLLLTSCTPSCGCTAPDCPKDPILPGKFTFISVNYTKMNDLGNFSKSLSVTSNDPNQPGLTITIRGEVKE